jgi:hypothetical protein
MARNRTRSRSPAAPIPSAAAPARLIGPDLIKALVILVSGILVLSPVLRGHWYGDDDLYLVNNPLLYDPARLWKAWFVPGSFVDYYPIGQAVEWYQWRLWGTDSPFPYLVCNLVLHLTSALLLWQLLARLGLRLAWLGGLIFAIHPLMVDSVGVSSELKNTLSLPPFLLAMICYLDFDETRKPRDYVLTLLFFVIAMLCKITMDFFPFVILLYAWWKRGRISRADIVASLPFFAVSLVLGLTFLHAGVVYAGTTQYISPGPIHLGGIPERLALAGLSLLFYFGHSFLPYHPVPFYPLWPLDPLTPLFFLPWLAIAIVVFTCWRKRDSWGRPTLFALGFFTLGLVPFLGLNEVSYMCLGWVWDHFLYIPIIALIGLVVAGLDGIARQLPQKFLVPATAILVALLALLGFQTWTYAKLFTTPEELWVYNLRSNPNAWMAHHLYAHELTMRDANDDAIAEERASLQINPAFDNAQMTLGLVLCKVGDYAEATKAFQACLRINPHYGAARFWLGFALVANGRSAEAIEPLSIFLQAHPNNVDGHLALAQALAKAGRLPEAHAEIETADKISPGNPKVQALREQLRQTQPPAAEKN